MEDLERAQVVAAAVLVLAGEELDAGGCDGRVWRRSTPSLWSSVREEGVMSALEMGARERSMILVVVTVAGGRAGIGV